MSAAEKYTKSLLIIQNSPRRQLDRQSPFMIYWIRQRIIVQFSSKLFQSILRIS